jgi:multidrug resistance protein, MATE family
MAVANTHPDLKVVVSNRQILKIALPISFAILVPQLNFITNNIFLGLLSEEALGTAAITGVYYLIFGSIGFALNNGLQALIARRAGENRPEEIGKLFSQGLFIALSIAATGILLTYTLAPFILSATLKNEQIIQQAISFLKMRIWGLPFLYVYQMRNALLVGTNQSRYLIAGTLAEAVANIVFDYVLIFGKWGFPEMGFNGAAVASIIAEFLGMAVVFLVIHYKGIGKRFALFKNFGYDAVNVNLILRQSSPLIFQHAISIISWELFYILISRNSTTPHDLSISNAMRNFFGLFGVFSWAFSATASTMVSNVIGQGLQNKVPELIRKIVTISTSVALALCVLLNLFPGVFLAVYGQTNDWINHAIPVTRVVSVALVMMSFSVVWLSSVTGTGNTRVSLMIEAVTILLYCGYVWFVMEVMHCSIIYGWMSEWLYWLSLFTWSYFYIRSGRWKGKVI